MARALLLLLFTVLAGCDVRSGGGGGLRRFEEARAPLIGILVTPEQVVVPLGGTVQLTATGLFEDRTSDDVTAQVEWRVADEGTAKVSGGLDEEGLLTGKAVGRTEVWARLDGVSSPRVEVVVTDQVLEALTVEPAQLTLSVGQRVPLTATARWSDGSLADASAQVRWITDDADVVAIDAGEAVGVGKGSTTVRAVWDEVEAAPVQVDVVGEAKAELRIVDLDIWTSGDEVLVNVEIENSGGAGASTFWVDGFVDPNGDPEVGDVGDGYERVTYVGPGELTAVTLSIPGVSEGSHDLVVFVDTNDEVDEFDEGDNLFADTVVVNDVALPADIVVEDFAWVGDGWNVYYWIELANYGDEPTGDFDLDLYLDRINPPYAGLEGDYYVDVPSIDPWTAIAFEVAVPLDCVGCWSWIQADSMEQVAEAHEDDNVAGPLVVTN